MRDAAPPKGRRRQDLCLGGPCLGEARPGRTGAPVRPVLAGPAEAEAQTLRRHAIENLPHHVRDRTFREDDSKVRTGHLPRTMTGLRDLGISLFRQNGETDIAAALRHTSRDHHRALSALSLT